MTQSTDLYLEITDAGDIIRIEPINLINPNTDLDWDRNWIKTQVTVKGGAFSGQFVAEFMTTDFEIFKQQLKQLDTNFSGSAKFEPLESQLVLTIKGDGLGHFELYCEATPEPHLGQTLSFSISFDQTQTKEYVRQLDKITKRFPIDGDFNIKNE
ncbi:hypothetical protein [Flavihumibacter solisilvae]|uniref:WapI family immunity protein n=1 Tax=Flavihumibacter solisilvae TaxID=1349421 RepID=UPI00068BC836|nr:hypothetical protein [Flavihumibacter solisilvae]